MIVYIQVLRPTGTNRCICSDCYMCPQGGCTKYPSGEVRISKPNTDELIKTLSGGVAAVSKIILSESEKKLLDDMRKPCAERGTQCRL